jgi:hypothetical protein
MLKNIYRSVGKDSGIVTGIDNRKLYNQISSGPECHFCPGPLVKECGFSPLYKMRRQDDDHRAAWTELFRLFDMITVAVV